MDEPTAMLDPVGRAKVMRTILSLNKKQGITIVLITHFMEDAALADRVAVLHKGKLVRVGSPKEVFSQADYLRSIDLDVPPAAELCAELRRQGVALPADIVTADECVDALAALFSEDGKKRKPA